MNKDRRSRINKIINQLTDLAEEIEAIREEEQEAYDNLPGSIMESERGEMMNDNISDLEIAQDDVSQAIEYLTSIIEK